MSVIPDLSPARPASPSWLSLRRPSHVVERNATHYKHSWFLVISGAVEPIMFLLSARVGLGRLVGGLPGPDGRVVTYAAFVGPAMLAAAASQGAVFDTTFNFFHKLRYAKTYDGMLATPMQVRDVALGELWWALIRATVQSTMFLCVMAAFLLYRSWWAVLALPAAVLVSWCFAGMGLAATTYVRAWRDFDWFQLALLPMFLLSASFFPLSVYPTWAQWVVQATPLYQGVALLRVLVLGGPDWSSVGHAAYLALMGWLCLRHATRRMARLLLH